MSQIPIHHSTGGSFGKKNSGGSIKKALLLSCFTLLLLYPSTQPLIRKKIKKHFFFLGFESCLVVFMTKNENENVDIIIKSCQQSKLGWKGQQPCRSTDTCLNTPSPRSIYQIIKKNKKIKK